MTELYFKILAAVAPAIVLAVIMIKRDKQREPLGWLLGATAMGVGVALSVIVLGIFVLPDFYADTFVGAFLTSFVNAAIPEEGLKFVALYLLATRCRYFDELFDGVIYAVCIGMGFAALENVLYLFSADEWISVGLSRAFLSVPMHYFFAIIMGSFFALGWFDERNRRFYMTAALVLPIVVHGLYDTLCFSVGINENLSFILLAAFILGFSWIRKYVKSLTISMQKLDQAP